MQLNDAPDKIVLPFGDDGDRNTIPLATGTPGAASLEEGFPALTMTPVGSGGIPPNGRDMNGILWLVSAISRWMNAGAGFPYDNTFATAPDVGGYPAGARVARADGEGYWLNVVDNNTTDPDAGGAGWVPDIAGTVTPVTMTNANVTLTAEQYGRQIILITGTLSANLNLVMPDVVGKWAVINSTSGSFTINVKTSLGAGVATISGQTAFVVCDGTDIKGSVSDNLSSGLHTVSMSATDVTLTLAEAKKQIIVISGTLLANVNLILPNVVGQWLIVNNATGNFTVTVKTAAGTGVATRTTTTQSVFCDATNVALSDRSQKSLGIAFPFGGYWRFNEGLILQWSQSATVSGGTITINFPITFPNMCIIALPVCLSATPNAYVATSNIVSASQLMVNTADGTGSPVNVGFQYLAIGF